MKKMILMSLLIIPAFFYSACQSDEDTDLCVPNPQEDCVCFQIYDPVCGCDKQTYSNYCEAECNGIFDYTPGPCK